MNDFQVMYVTRPENTVLTKWLLHYNSTLYFLLVFNGPFETFLLLKPSPRRILHRPNTFSNLFDRSPVTVLLYKPSSDLYIRPWDRISWTSRTFSKSELPFKFRNSTLSSTYRTSFIEAWRIMGKLYHIINYKYFY